MFWNLVVVFLQKFSNIYSWDYYQSINQFISDPSTKQRGFVAQVTEYDKKKEKINNNKKRDYNQQTQI